jgi:hypothetical protein
MLAATFTARKERVRLRAVRFSSFMDRVDLGHDVPARLEQVVRFIYRNLTF